jgi:hypothetical protein
MVKINTFFTEWWSGPTSADRQGQNTANPAGIRQCGNLSYFRELLSSS